MIDEDLEALLPALEGFHARFGRFFRRSEGRAVEPQVPDRARPADRAQERREHRRAGRGAAAQAPGVPVRVALGRRGLHRGAAALRRRAARRPGRGARPRRHGLPQEGDPLGGRRSPVQRHARAGRQLPGRGVPGLCQPPRPHPRRPAALPRRGLARRSREAGLAAGRGARDVRFRTKLELARRDAGRGHRARPPARRLGDRGRRLRRQRRLRALVASHGRWYCVEVSGTTEVWTADPAWARAAAVGPHGPTPHQGAARPDAVPAQAVREIVRTLPPATGSGIA